MSDINSDKELVKTIVLSNNDRFYFSRKYDEKVVGEAIEVAEKVYAMLEDYSLLPGMEVMVEKDFRQKSVHGTVAIEGNPLTEEEVGTVLAYKKKKKLNRSEQEVLNIDRAFDLLEEEAGQICLSEDVITTFHSVIMRDIDNVNAGKYRHERVKVGDAEHGGIETPPDRLKDIQLLMKEFITFINSSEVVGLNPMLRGALAHYHLARIHPFLDGNGRTSRIIEALIMKGSKTKYIPELLSYSYNRNVDEYYWAFSKTRKDKLRDISEFLRFVFKSVLDSLFYANKKLLSYIEEVLLDDHYKVLLEQRTIVQRQHDLLQTLLKTSEEITLKHLLIKLPYKLLYENVADRTARRDLAKLIKLNLLCLSEDGKYSLNRDILKIQNG